MADSPFCISKSPFKCDICKKLFRSKNSLTNHISRTNHTAEAAKANNIYNIGIKCHICEMNFNHRNTFEAHIKRVHLESHLSCDICGKNYLTNEGLQHHKQSFHGKN